MEISKSFINITEKIGRDINLVQGPGGNISFKKDGFMYIKASGERMSDAKNKNIFIKTDLNKILSSLKKNDPDPIKNSWEKSSLMRPSIETTMHALMPHKYVLHVHCVNTLSWVIQKNYKKNINFILKGINWKSVPYKKPGLNLSYEIKKIIRESIVDVILLDNHGIVAGAESAKNVFEIVKSISEKLSLSNLNKKKVDLKKFNKFLSCREYKLPRNESIHQIAFSKTHSLIATKGDIFPDQTVFLENGLMIINSLEELIRLSKLSAKKLPVVLIPNIGILIPRIFKEVNEDTLVGLSMIISRLPKNASINYLTKKERNELINWDLEIHRKKINN